MASKTRTHFHTWYLESIPVSVKSRDTHFQTTTPTWLKSIPSSNQNDSKTIPFGAAHAFTAYRGVPPPPRPILDL